MAAFHCRRSLWTQVLSSAPFARLAGRGHGRLHLPGRETGVDASSFGGGGLVGGMGVQTIERFYLSQHCAVCYCPISLLISLLDSMLMLSICYHLQMPNTCTFHRWPACMRATKFP